MPDSHSQETETPFRIEDLPRPHTPELDALIASGKIVRDQLAYRLDTKGVDKPNGVLSNAHL